MGWVEHKIADLQATAKSVTPLWNSLRDSIGEAVTDFQYAIHESGVKHGDCKARGKMCVRVQKPDHFIEIFLSEPDQTIQSVIDDGEPQEIARYRLTENRSGLEFSIENIVVSADDIAKRALETFLFERFPLHLVVTRRPG